MVNIFSKSRPPSEIAAELKRKCVGYVNKYLMKDFWLSEQGQGLLTVFPEKPETVLENTAYESEWIEAMDWYILFGQTQTGRRVLTRIRDKAKLDLAERQVIKEWLTGAFPSMFEVKQMHSNHFDLFDVVAEVNYKVFGNDPNGFLEFSKTIKPGMFIRTRLVPTRGVWFLSGSQQLLPASDGGFIFQNYVSRLMDQPDWYRNNPEKLEQAFALQKEHCNHFVKLFGNDEVIVPGREVARFEREFYDSWAREHGHINRLKPPELPEDFLESEDVGLVMDGREGWHHFIDYGAFVSIFKEAARPAKWKELVLGYLEDNNEEGVGIGVPAFVFRRMKDRYPEGFREVLSEVLPEWSKQQDPINDFVALMDEYKPGWQEVYPSVHPLNERFKQYYYQAPDVRRNDPCPCGSGLKYKKCHGK